MANFGILRLVGLLMKCPCIAPLTPAMMVIRGLVFQPLFFKRVVFSVFACEGVFVIVMALCAVGILMSEGPENVFLWFSMYWAYLDFKVWVIWASVTLSAFQKWLKSLWFI